jgi:hypothetical protein
VGGGVCSMQSSRDDLRSLYYLPYYYYLIYLLPWDSPSFAFCTYLAEEGCL